MFTVSSHRPDVRVFVKRLVIPRYIQTTNGASHLDANILRDAFSTYLPEEFRPDLIKAYAKKWVDASTAVDAVRQKLKTESIGLEQDINILKTKIAEIRPPLRNDTYDQELSTALDKKAYIDDEISNLDVSFSTLRSLYEPYLLELSIGVTSVTTNITRNGIGNASVVIKLPLEENGFLESVLTAIKNDEIWNLDENLKSVSSVNNMRNSKPESSRSLNIFKLIRQKKKRPNEKTKEDELVDTEEVIGVDRRECSLLPHDMIQIWFPKRYKDTAQGVSTKTQIDIPRFPDDYLPAFTGFITKTDVTYTGGQSPSYTISIAAEDVGHTLRISRANIDPAIDPQYRARGLNVTAFQNNLAVYDNEPKTGSELIRGLVQGRVGYWWGVSQLELISDVMYDDDTKQYSHVSYPDSRGVRIVNMAWEFDHIPLHLFDDLISSYWQPYVASFKQSFRLWESEYKYRWDICKEIAEIMEFEFYADGFGVINYHPPFYNYNPANIKYLIENKEIRSETHSYNETNAVTMVEVVSQSIFNVLGDNIARILSTFAVASDEFIQRFGVRFRTKNIPALSGTERDLQNIGGTVFETRNLYARAWLNRRNAELKSATVEIPGTPEMFLCNTVAFVDDMSDILKGIAVNNIVPGSVVNTVADKLPNVEVGLESTITPSKNPTINTLLDNMKVYYITGVSHKYTQGGDFATTLTLTHGRTWNTHWNLGYSYSEKENDKIYNNFKTLALGQKQQEADTFVTGLAWNGKPFNLPPALTSMGQKGNPVTVKLPKGPPASSLAPLNNGVTKLYTTSGVE